MPLGVVSESKDGHETHLPFRSSPGFCPCLGPLELFAPLLPGDRAPRGKRLLLHGGALHKGRSTCMLVRAPGAGGAEVLLDEDMRPDSSSDSSRPQTCKCRSLDKTRAPGAAWRRAFPCARLVLGSVLCLWARESSTAPAGGGHGGLCTARWARCQGKDGE